MNEHAEESTPTGVIQHASQPEPSLLDQPQRLGFLPTWWFWRDNDNSKLVKWPIWIAIAAAFTLALVFDVGWILAGLLPVLTIMITLGLIERYVRRRVLKRRTLVGAGNGPAIGNDDA